MVGNQEEPESMVQDYQHERAVLIDTLRGANTSQIGDRGSECRERIAASEQQAGTSPPLDPLEAIFSEDKYARALQTVKSARSSRSDTMYNETPPDFDVGTDKAFCSLPDPPHCSLGANGCCERSRLLLMMMTMDVIQLSQTCRDR